MSQTSSIISVNSYQEMFERVFSKESARNRACSNCGSPVRSHRDVVCPPSIFTIRFNSPDNAWRLVSPIVCPPLLSFGGERFKLLGAINHNESAHHFSSCIVFKGHLYSAQEGLPSTEQKYLSRKDEYSERRGWDGILGKSQRSTPVWVFYAWVETIVL